jgi:meso-butanediol dehydrogenase / (S,S)-butanediol dehydrogenase / diacetyl reductase
VVLTTGGGPASVRDHAGLPRRRGDGRDTRSAPQRLEQALEGYPAERTAAIAADVSDGSQVTAMVEVVVRRFGRLDVVASNAAGHETGPITDLDD